MDGNISFFQNIIVMINNKYVLLYGLWVCTGREPTSFSDWLSPIQTHTPYNILLHLTGPIKLEFHIETS